ncbi:bifunctional diguanylate cyclase/phosphodiesterase [Paenibacillus sp. FJAT-26967]|uniref:sensor domain-containing protein n=1 Tax=Paenibacillus sp. FJAT-26967 TaxID=1729690 RepID=UPI000AE43696|nr:bifunctional diguanylate cyclase/phosphodiesterase [Paenibacillus sp. FJAT-26967]
MGTTEKTSTPDTDSDSLRYFLNQMSIMTDNNQSLLPFYQTLFQTLFNNAPIGIYILQGEHYTYVNNYYSKLLGYTAPELTDGSVSLEQIIHPDDFEMIQQRIKSRRAGEPADGQYVLRKFHKDGSLIYTEIHASAAEIEGRTVLFGSVIDITERVLTQQKLLESNEQYKSLFYNSPDAIFSFDDEGNFLSANPASEVITGYTTEELLNMSFAPLIHPEDLPEAIKHFEDAKNGIPSSGDLVITKKDGTPIHLNATHFPMKVGGVITGTYGLARDITQRILYDQQMEQFAFYDPLTGLPNRKLFEDRLGQLMNYSEEDRKQFAVLFLDLDRFKLINDSLGHHLGDEFLKMVAVRLSQVLKPTDTFSRLAGDEFTILLPETSREEAQQTAEAIIDLLAEPFQVEGHSVTVTASIGIAFGKGRENTVHELIRNADTAMYYTKKFRKTRYTIYSEEMDQNASYKLTIERDLKFAIEKNELELFYQPIIDLKTEQITAMEALIRWKHPELGLVPPSDFIPVAEESGQIITIGSWVLHTACQQAKAWQDSDVPPFKVAVNISTKQLQHENFVDSVIEILGTTNLAPKWLELEITESILLDDVELINESLLKLKQAGVFISIDDFGTGYTSLSYLRQYPFDKVKIDRSFIDDINRDLNGKRIASAIISLAHSLNMNVVAEGIENEVQWEYLIEEKCNEGQGYFFSRPLPVHSLQLHSPMKFASTGKNQQI